MKLLLRLLSGLPLQRKLQAIILIAVGAALSLASGTLLVGETITLRDVAARGAGARAGLLQERGAAAMASGDGEFAQALVQTLGANRVVAAAALYTADGAMLAAYSRPGGPGTDLPASAPGSG